MGVFLRKTDKPQLITLLGHDYVIWKDEEGQLNALDNICPHAGANLAKGGYILDFKGGANYCPPLQ